TTFMKDQKDIHKVYLINENYSHGQQVSRFAKENLARKRSDIQVVGDDLHPLAQVRDFAPYVAKIKASGADTVITGNWGSDLTLLVKAAHDAGLDVKFYTYYAGVTGKLGDQFKAKFNDDYYTLATFHAFAMLSSAMAQAKTTDPAKVARAMEGLRFKSFNGDVEMRKSDHQLQQPLYVTVWKKADAKNPYSVENTGYNFQTVKYYDSYVSSTPTSCDMKRPGSP